MGGDAPRGGGLEQVVLEQEVAGEGPVVRDLPGVVVAHDVRAPAVLAVRRQARSAAALRVVDQDRPDEPVHAAPVDGRPGVPAVVQPAHVHQARVVVGALAPLQDGVFQAPREVSVPGGVAVRSGEGAEVGVERSVLLHHEHQVLQLAGGGSRRGKGRGSGALGGGGQRRALFAGRAVDQHPGQQRQDDDEAEAGSEHGQADRRVATMEVDPWGGGSLAPRHRRAKEPSIGGGRARPLTAPRCRRLRGRRGPARRTSRSSPSRGPRPCRGTRASPEAGRRPASSSRRRSRTTCR